MSCHQINLALDPFKYKINKIVCVIGTQYDTTLPRYIQDTFFPQAHLYIVNQELVPDEIPLIGILETYEDSDLVIIQNPTQEENYYNVIFAKSLIILIGTNGNKMKTMEEQYTPKWRIIMKIRATDDIFYGNQVSILEKNYTI